MSRTASARLLGLICMTSVAASGCSDDAYFALRLLPPFFANGGQPVRIETDLPYTERDGTSLCYDYYYPASAGEPRPLIILLYGAGWQAGPRDQLMEFAYDLAAHGYAAATIDYRLAGDTAAFPAQVADVFEAIEFFRRSTDRGIDPDRIGLFGASAGAHLALLVGMADNLATLDPLAAESAPARVKIVVNLFGPTDLTIDPPTDPPWLKGLLETFLGGSLDQTAELRHRASPVVYARQDGPAIFTVHGTADRIVPVSQARELLDATDAAGEVHQYVEIPGMGHSIGAIWITAEAQSFRQALFEFLAQHL